MESRRVPVLTEFRCSSSTHWHKAYDDGTLIDSFSPYYPRIISGLLSSIIYGLVLTLCTSCIRSLLQSKMITRRRLLLLAGYVSLMTGISTVGFVVGSRILLPGMGMGVESGSGLGSGLERDYMVSIVVLPLAIWGADGLMIWRCVILYEGTPNAQKRVLKCLLAILSLASVGSGVVFLIAMIKATKEMGKVDFDTRELGFKSDIGDFVALISTYTLLLSITTATNLIVAALIASRLLWHQYRTRNALGDAYGYASSYNAVISVCVESCALIVFFNIATFAVFFGCVKSFLMHGLGSQVSVFSALLIISRVARSRDAIANVQSIDAEKAIQSLRFEISLSDPPAREEGVSELASESNMVSRNNMTL